MLVNFVIKTAGTGLWSNKVKAVRCEGIELGYLSEDMDFGELRVVFDTKDWDVYEDGLIYTDELFLQSIKSRLGEIGFNVSDLEYSEQGMQGNDYVSFDVGELFIQSWAKIDPEYVKDVYMG